MERLRVKIYKQIFIIVSCLTFSMMGISCTKKRDSNEQVFNRKAMLENYVDHLITPAFSQLAVQTDSLQVFTLRFLGSPSPANLDLLQKHWVSSYTAWQYCAPYNFGPSESIYGTIKELVAGFPADENEIDNAIAANDTTLKLNMDARDARGFVAMEYLIFNPGNPNEIVNSYTGKAAGNRASYLRALAADIQKRCQEAAENWKNHRQQFIADDGTNAGSSTSLLYNEFVRDYERLKNYKVGLPLGKQLPFPVTPSYVEAYRSGYSLSMLKANFEAITALWYGRARNGTDGIGFDDYLMQVYAGPGLAAEIKIQLQAIDGAIDQISPVRLSDAIIQNPAKVESVYTELSKNTHLLKSEMSSLLGIAITFSSGDGD